MVSTTIWFSSLQTPPYSFWRNYKSIDWLCKFGIHFYISQQSAFNQEDSWQKIAKQDPPFMDSAGREWYHQTLKSDAPRYHEIRTSIIITSITSAPAIFEGSSWELIDLEIFSWHHLEHNGPKVAWKFAAYVLVTASADVKLTLPIKFENSPRKILGKLLLLLGMASTRVLRWGHL